MDSEKSSINPPKRSKRSRRSTPSNRRTWTPEEDSLIDGLKELCVNGWRADNGTFRPGYLTKLEYYLRERHPDSGLKGEPHINSKLKAWKRSHAHISLLKGRSGLGFQYSDGTIIVDDSIEWEKFLKKIFGKDRATGEHAEGPLDAVEDILKNQTSRLSIDMTLGFPINIYEDEDEDDYGGSHGPNIATGEAENAYIEPSFAGASENEYARGSPHERTDRSEKQAEYAKKSSSNVNEKEKSKKRKRVVEDANETFVKSMTEVIKDYTETQDKRIGALIDKIGIRDHSDMRDQVYAIIESPAFDLYTIEQRIKAKMVICRDVQKMKIFLRMLWFHFAAMLDQLLVSLQLFSLQLLQYIRSAVIDMGPEKLLALFSISLNTKDYSLSNSWSLHVVNKYTCPYQDGKYTWRKGDTRETARLDRFLVSMDLNEGFRNIKQTTMHKITSSHFPVMLQCGSLGNSPRITQEENQLLQSPFGEQEIWESVKFCARDKAPGPNGFSMAFFTQCWEVVKTEVVAVVQNFYEQGVFEKSFNATFVALIPKKVGAKELKDFRPISLIGSFCKIIAKILIEILKKVMNKLVGFGGRWVSWIRYCISTVKFSILINGSPVGFFQSQRGLRQGDPLSPFLFIIAMEGLHDLLKTAQTNKWIRGFKVKSSTESDNNRGNLYLFEATSGLHINWTKSFIFPVNKQEGRGLGIKNLKSQSQSLMLKWLWRFASDESLWKEVIKEKYDMEGKWTTKTVEGPYEGLSVEVNQEPVA
ncbi:putative HUA2-like protein 3-like [Capsicum annuum]|nr:putative HUA2-like protein 3-like [Capsicum annuum]